MYTYERLSCLPYGSNVAFLMSSVKNELSVPANYYPNFSDWFNKVVLELTDGIRSIIIARRLNRISGIAILKHSPVENKICTFWVNPENRKHHVGSAMLLRCCSLFFNNPTISMPGYLLWDFCGFRKYFSFVKKEDGIYRKNQSEFFFNVELTRLLNSELLTSQNFSPALGNSNFAVNV